MERVTKIINDIKSLRIQGAHEISKAGIQCLKITAKKSSAKTKGKLISELKNIIKKLMKARPTEPELHRNINTVLIKAEHYESENPEITKKYIIRLCDDLIRQSETILTKIATFGANQIQNDETILTHCHSHDVVAIFKEAKRQGKKFTVIVTETRPKNQGLITAKELLKSKIKVIYCIDSAIGHVMKKADKVIVGCDAILADGSIVNKIGTFPMALVAKAFGKPFIVAGETMKFDPKTIQGIPEPIEQRDIHEIINPSKIRRAKIINPAFDITPSDYIEFLITERGIMKPELLRESIELRPPT